MEPSLEMFECINLQTYNELFNRKLSEFDWSCLHQGTVIEANSLFIFIEFVNCAYQIKQL